MAHSSPGRGFAILRHGDFTRFLIARFAAAVAAQMIVLAVGWQVYHLTGRVLDLGLVGLSQFLPFVAFALLAGHAADRFDRRRMLWGCLAAYLSCALGLALYARVGSAGVLPIFAMLGLLGIARAFLNPTAQALLPNLVPPESFGNAVALNSSAFQVATIAGPSLGGLVYALGERGVAAANGPGGGGAGRVYEVAGALLLIALGAVSTLRQRRPQTPPAWAPGALLDGLRFIWHRKTVLGAVSLDLFAVLFGGAAALLPAYTHDVLRAGPAVFGTLRAAPGLGAVAMALLLAFHPIHRRVGPVMFLGVAVFGVAVIVLGLTANVAMALLALIVLGAGDMISIYVRAMLVQLETPDAIRGRVSAVNSVCIGASNELGEFESGLTAAVFGLTPSIVLGGVLTLLVTVVWARYLFPALWRLQNFAQLKDLGPDGKPHAA